MRRAGNAATQSVKGFGRHTLHITNHGETHVVLNQIGCLTLYRNPDEVHKGIDLCLWTVPVLGRKRIKCQEPHPGLRCGLGNTPHGVHPFHMPFGAVKPASLRPAPVAIHDYGHMCGDARIVDFLS